eukprot:COSAG05_NODE_19525_length_291_cov_0.807292_1_plen_89_part_01
MLWQICSLLSQMLTIWLSASCALWRTSIKLAAWTPGKNAFVPFWQAPLGDTAQAGSGFFFTWLVPALLALVPLLKSITMTWIMQTKISW